MTQSLGSPSWQVVLLGGASGTGKTSVSYDLARRLGMGLTEVDDFQIVLQQLTTPAEQPVLHRCWDAGANLLPAEEIVELQVAVGEVLRPALAAVVANHLETATPMMLEGDYILPSLAYQCLQGAGTGRVAVVFLYEPDERQLLRNYEQREPSAAGGAKRARVSWLYGRWLKSEAERHGLPVIEARPWDTALDRALSALARTGM